MLGWEVIEGQQFFSVLDQTFSGFRVLCLEGFNEQIDSGMRIFSRLSLPASRDIAAQYPDGQ